MRYGGITVAAPRKEGLYPVHEHASGTRSPSRQTGHTVLQRPALLKEPSLFGRKHMKQYLGIDIGGTDVKIGIVAADGTIAVKKSYSVDFDSYKTPIMTTVLHSIDLFLRENTLFITGISGIGVSATGQIDFK